MRYILVAKTLATFRIDEDVWKGFQEWAKSKGSNASSEIIKFVLASLGRIETSEIPLEDINSRLDRYLAINLDNKLNDCLDERFDKFIDKCIDKKLTDSLDRVIYNKIDIDNKISNAVNDAVTALEAKFLPILDAHKEIEELREKLSA